jgi:hypothetical protein
LKTVNLGVVQVRVLSGKQFKSVCQEMLPKLKLLVRM